MRRVEDQAGPIRLSCIRHLGRVYNGWGSERLRFDGEWGLRWEGSAARMLQLPSKGPAAERYGGWARLAA